MRKRTINFIVAGVSLVINILFYTIGYPESGAMYAWEIHPLFAIAMQIVISIPIVGYTYFGIKNL